MNKKLQKLLDLNVNFDDYYNIMIDTTSIQLMATFKPKLLSHFKSLGYEFTYSNEHPWLLTEKDGIKILLTLN